MDYKKILEDVVDIISTTEKSDIGFANICTYIGENCPELVNEDEKIIKALIDYFDDANKADENPLQSYGVHTDKVIAWLEKLENQVDTSVFDVPKISIKNAVEVTSRMQYIDDDIKPIAEFIIDYANWDLHKDKWNQPTLIVPLFRVLDALIQRGKPYCECSQNIENQNEQKPAEAYNITGIGSKHAQGKLGEMINNLKPVNEVLEQKSIDNVEPKFKVGDWITDGKALLCITKFEIDYGYELKATDGEVLHFVSPDLVEAYYHHWSIQDAKDGDVLATDSGRPFIFKGCLDERHANSPVAYCGIDIMRLFRVSSYDNWWTDGNVHPATKEQHDLLFTKMKEAGYKLDENLNIVKI